jgi:hypothetical protein
VLTGLINCIQCVGRSKHNQAFSELDCGSIPGLVAMAGGMEVNKNKYIEEWGTARENLEKNFRWTRRNLAWQPERRGDPLLLLTIEFQQTGFQMLNRINVFLIHSWNCRCRILLVCFLLGYTSQSGDSILPFSSLPEMRREMCL